MTFIQTTLSRERASFFYYCASRRDRVSYNVDKISVRSRLYDNRKMSFTTAEPRYSLPTDRGQFPSLRSISRTVTFFLFPSLFFHLIHYSVARCYVPGYAGTVDSRPISFVRNFVQALCKRNDSRVASLVLKFHTSMKKREREREGASVHRELLNHPPVWIDVET